MITVSGARRVFGSGRRATVALDSVDLTVGRDELVVVVGPSGSGKTTLLRVVAGLDRLVAGRVEIGNVDVTDRPPGERDVAMVFQDFALLPHLSVHDNIGFGERARGSSRGDTARKAEAAAEALGLSTVLDRRPGELSGGERQRVALARAIVREPAAFLLDEPLSSLDTELRLSARARIRELQRRLGVAMLYVTHDQHEALALADRIVVLRDGRVEQTGTPTELFHRPANGFVARFVSPMPMNLLGGLPGLTDGHVLGVRPEHLRLVSPGQGDDGSRVEGRVVAVEPAGDQAVVHVALDQQRVLARVAWEDRPEEGAVVGLGWRPDDEHRFAGVDGARVP